MKISDKIILITGAHGFLGRYAAKAFSRKGYRVIAIGHGDWGFEDPRGFGIEEWIEADIDFAALAGIGEPLDYIIHCAGGSSVGYSVQFPEQDFFRTVGTTVAVLEYARLHQPQAKIVYPSSAAVYGIQDANPIGVGVQPSPLSPYGFHKHMAEELCISYARNYSLDVGIVRLFSVYGPGLRKQLLWDACIKLTRSDTGTQFYGTGNETRDWIHIRDAAALLLKVAQSEDRFTIVNGGSGSSTKIREILLQLADLLGGKTDIVFSGAQKEGDPLHYLADITEAKALGWQPQVRLDEGLEEYVKWFRNHAKV